MHFDMAGIGQQPLKIKLGDPFFEQVFPPEVKANTTLGHIGDFRGGEVKASIIPKLGATSGNEFYVYLAAYQSPYLYTGQLPGADDVPVIPMFYRTYRDGGDLIASQIRLDWRCEE